MDKARKIIRVTVAIALIIVLSMAVCLFIITDPNVKTNVFPDFNRQTLEEINENHEIYDEQHNKLWTINGKGTLKAKISELNEHTINAFIAIEDKKFFSHNGYDLSRIISATIRNISAGSAKEGASTITQQLAKNTYLSPEKTFSRKITELRYARVIEKLYDKDEILEAYLNSVYFGNDIVGIESASQRYFSKKASELDLGESAMLAAVINNPKRYDPISNNEATEKRKRLVLSEMRELNLISKNDQEKYSEKTELKLTVVNDGLFIGYASEQARSGKSVRFAKDVQNVIKSILYRFTSADYTTAIAVVDVKSGKVISATSDTYFDIYGLKRSPGSTIKPFISYAPALESKTITPLTPLLDTPMKFGNYEPKNYRNKYYDWTSAKDCLALSLNIPAVKLLEMNGVEYSKKLCNKFGFEFTKSDNGLALALGGMQNGVDLITLTKAYAHVANGGDGIISTENAYLLTKMLNETVKTGTATAIEDKNISAKTGTVGNENGNTDAYCIAYNKKYAVGVWCGSLKGLMPDRVTGGETPTEICNEILKRPELKSGAFERPKTVLCVDIDAVELEKRHLVVTASASTPPKNRISGEFSVYNLPDKKTDEDLSFGDYENFKIVDGFVD